jgi:hypothetical protein
MKRHIVRIVFFFVCTLGGIRSGMTQQPGPAAPAGGQEAAAVFTYDDHGRRDPLWPLVSPAGNIIDYEKKEFQFTDLKLEGIISGAGDKNLAIINGQILKVNDHVGSFVVTQIGKDTVVLMKDQREFTLELKKEE